MSTFLSPFLENTQPCIRSPVENYCGRSYKRSHPLRGGRAGETCCDAQRRGCTAGHCSELAVLYGARWPPRSPCGFPDVPCRCGWGKLIWDQPAPLVRYLQMHMGVFGCCLGFFFPYPSYSTPGAGGDSVKAATARGGPCSTAWLPSHQQRRALSQASAPTGHLCQWAVWSFSLFWPFLT